MKKVNILPQKDNKVEEDFIYQAPFYGKKGTIKNIKMDSKDDKYYLVTRYDISGKDGDVFPVPKKKKIDLQNEYMSDIKNYLESLRIKYVNELNHVSSSKDTKNKRILVACLTSFVTFISLIGSAVATDSMLYFFLTVFFTGFVSSCYELNFLRKEFINEKNFLEKKEYEKYLNIYSDYCTKKEKTKKKNPTKYSNLENSNDKVVDINLKKVLEKKAS